MRERHFVDPKCESSMKLVRFMDNLITVSMVWRTMMEQHQARATEHGSKWVRERDTVFGESFSVKFHVWCYTFDTLCVSCLPVIRKFRQNVCALEINENWWTNTIFGPSHFSLAFISIRLFPHSCSLSINWKVLNPKGIKITNFMNNTAFFFRWIQCMLGNRSLLMSFNSER